jgi:hypothetical protein
MNDAESAITDTQPTIAAIQGSSSRHRPSSSKSPRMYRDASPKPDGRAVPAS